MQESHEQAMAELEEDFGEQIDTLRRNEDEAVESAREKDREEHEVRYGVVKGRLRSFCVVQDMSGLGLHSALTYHRCRRFKAQSFLFLGVSRREFL